MGNQRFSITPAVAVSDSRVSDAQFRTLAALGVFGDKNGWLFPSLATLGSILHKSKQAVSKDIQALKSFGYLQVRPQFKDDGSRSVNRIRVLFDNLPEIPPSTSEVDTPSTSEVDTPSTSEVDVNALLNAPNNAPLLQQEKPPAAQASSPEKPKPQRSPKQLAHDAEVKAVCEAFAKVSGKAMPPALFTKPSKQDVNAWIVQANGIIRTYNGRSVQAITEATQKHMAARDKDGKPLAMSGIRSVLWALPPLVEQPKQETVFKDY